MSTFWALCILNVLCVATISGSLFRTNGTSGPLCGKKHRCISEATCDKITGMCMCPKSLEGNGKLGCTNPLDAKVFLQSDPHMKNFYGEFLTVATPCRYLVTQYTLNNAEGYVAEVEVYAENLLQNGGIYYVNKILIQSSVMFMGDMMKENVLIQATAMGGEYVFSVTPLQDIEIDTAMDVVDNFTDFKISVTADEVDNFAVVKVKGAGLTVRFRPPPTDEADPTLVPGVTIIVDKDFLPDITFKRDAVASSPSGPSVREEARNRDVKEEEYTQLLAVTKTQSTEMEDPICRDTRRLFNGNNCLSDGMRLVVLRKCNALYTEQEFLTCLYEKNAVTEFYEEQKLLFRFCIQAFCTFNQQLCGVLKSRLPQTTMCEVPASLQNATCTDL